MTALPLSIASLAPATNRHLQGRSYLIVHAPRSPRRYSFPSHGDPQMCRCAYGVPANITIVPASRITVERPAAFASKGHRTIQCGPIGIGGLVLSKGSVKLC